MLSGVSLVAALAISLLGAEPLRPGMSEEPVATGGGVRDEVVVKGTTLTAADDSVVEPCPDGSALKSPVGLEWVYSKRAKLYFAKTETTVSQYRACVEARACGKENHYTKSDRDRCNWGHADRDDHPMNCLNWHGATQFCAWVGGRLPTEDEWYAEASNGGSRKYPWGDTEVTCNRAIWGHGINTDGCGKDSTWPVCSKTAGNSVSGTCDMSGNVWEWTSTQESSGRVLRCGSWFNNVTTFLRASARYRYDPGYGDINYGVRCVRVSQ